VTRPVSTANVRAGSEIERQRVTASVGNVSKDDTSHSIGPWSNSRPGLQTDQDLTTIGVRGAELAGAHRWRRADTWTKVQWDQMLALDSMRHLDAGLFSAS